MFYSVTCCFFFSSRRRHTRFDCDWSSDVCSSDLLAALHSSRASHGPSLVGCTTLSTKELFGREPDRLGRRGQSVRLHLSPAAIPAGATRLVVVPGGSAAGPTGTGRHRRNHRGGAAFQAPGGA